MKRIIPIIIAGSICFSATAVTAEENTVSNEVQEEKTLARSMDINGAINYALENSYKIKSVKADAEVKRYAMIEAKKSKTSFEENPYEASSFEISLLRRGYYTDMAQMAYDSALKTVAIEKDNLKNQVTTDFYKYYSCKNKEELAKTNLENAKEKVGFAKTRLESGIISQLDYDLFELSQINAQNSYTQAQRNTLLAVDSIKTTINFPIDEKLVILGAMPEIDIAYASADEAISRSRQQNTYFVLEASLKAAKKRYDAAMGYYFPHEYAYSSERFTYEKALADFNANVLSMDLGIKTMYNQILTLKENVDYTKKYLEYLKATTDVSYTKYEMGMMTASNYIDAEQEYFKANNDYADLLLSYRTAALQYKAMYIDEYTQEALDNIDK